MTTATAAGVRCGSCKDRHPSAYLVLCCYVAAGKVDGAWPCSWLVEAALATGDPDEPFYPAIVECGAPARYRADGTGYDCEAGHEHTDAQARQAQGWDYAGDDGEALLLARAGVEPREVDGHVWVRPLPV